MARSRYAGKLEELADIFGVDAVSLDGTELVVGSRRYPIVDDVIVLLPVEKYSESLRRRLKPADRSTVTVGFSEEVQYSFGDEWQQFGQILAEHEATFARYFDLVDLDSLGGSRVCDLGCGAGRWSSFLTEKCRSVVLVDFSDAIFVARKNLASDENCLFFMADLTDLPFRDGFADLLFSLGVLHHLPTPCLEQVRDLRRLANQLLVYLYYSLDNRPAHYRVALYAVTTVRKALSRIRNPQVRSVMALLLASLVYRPLVGAGALLNRLGLSTAVPLYEGYRGQSLAVLHQNAYDRFFTSIEQRVSRAEILALDDSFSEVIVSENLPYWHFLCTL